MTHTLLASLAALPVAMAVLTGCDGGRTTGPDPASPVTVTVSIPPLKGLVAPLAEAVGGEATSVIPPGVSEHGYEMSPSAVAAVAKADVVVVVGMGLDARVEEVAARGGRARVVQFAEVIGAEGGHDHDHHDHSHHDHDHDHGAGDPHLWLNPAHARQFVEAAAAVIDAAGRQKDGWTEQAGARLEHAAADLTRRIDSIDEQYRAALDRAPARTIVVAHDAWGHLAERYDLETIAISGLAGGEPRPEAIRRAVEIIQEKNLGAIYREPQMSDAACRRVAEAVASQTGREIKVLVLDPLGDGDWFAIMDANLAVLKEGLGIPGDASTPAESDE